MTFSWQRTLVVFRKELMDGFRDRRSLYSVLFSSLVSPLIMALLFTTMAERQRSADELRLPVAGQAYAPAFVDWLSQQSGITIIDAPANPEEAVRKGEQDVVLLIDKNFAAKFSRSLPAPVKLVGDVTRDTARPKVQRVRSLVNTYSSQIGSLRLMARGVSPAVASAIRLEDLEVSSAQQRAARILSFLPFLLVMAAFVGCLQIASDSTAGERERGSLEPLLLNPVPRSALIAGKWLAAACSGALSIVVSVLLCIVVLSRIPLHELGGRFHLGASSYGLLVVIVLPLVFCSSALVIFVAMLARSYKEAQTYLGLLITLPLLPGILAPLYPMTGKPWLAVFPIVGQYALMEDVLGGNPPAAIWYAVAALSLLGSAILLLALTTRQLRREAIIFGRG
ncbi:MAG: ABC transporter permease [Acidobacteria bacterium]|nr:ABC transporter permease [Acidobacteriota bacterium]